ncbi:MAG TPA: DUF4234 domain-containing protein [Sporichthyaceae bacterium]|nr:DUF4234 domain-containing protein [Sporichthyaceae bacterium]
MGDGGAFHGGDPDGAPSGGDADPPAQPPPSWQQPAYAMAPYGPPGHFGPPGTIRSTGTCVLLMIVTFGIYGIFWFGKTFGEIKRHTGQGLGGPWAVTIYLLTCGMGGLVLPFLCSAETGRMYERRGMPAPVSAINGLWVFLPLVGTIVWWVQTHNALNEYWEGCGARPA